MNLASFICSSILNDFLGSFVSETISLFNLLLLAFVAEWGNYLEFTTIKLLQFLYGVFSSNFLSLAIPVDIKNDGFEFDVFTLIGVEIQYAYSFYF